MGFGDELDAILHEYFEALKTDNHPHRSPQDLSSMVLELIDNTATLANMASKLHGSTDVSELRNVQALIRQHLIPTALKLSANIDTKLGSDPSIKLALAK